MKYEGIALPNASLLFGKAIRKRDIERQNNRRLAKGVRFVECDKCGATYSFDDECEWCE